MSSTSLQAAKTGSLAPIGRAAHRRLLVFTKSTFDPASRFRILELVPHLREAGWEVVHRPNRPDRYWSSPLPGRLLCGLHHRWAEWQRRWNRWRDLRDVASFDAVFVNRDLAGKGRFFETRLLRRNPRVVFDFDDAIFLDDNEPAVRWMCRHAARVTPGNEYLAEYARRWTAHVTVIPTILDTDRYDVKGEGDSPAGPVRVGWSGSDLSIPHTLFPFLDLLTRLQEEIPFELVVISDRRPEIRQPNLRWSFCRWSASQETALCRQMEIGIMPLRDDEFQRGKCGLKLLQYMAAGLPTIASPVGVNAEITQPAVTGYLARDAEQWRRAVRELVTRPQLRAGMGSAGRQRCVNHFSTRRWMPEILRLLESVARGVRGDVPARG